MGGFLKSKGKTVPAFESPGITDAGVMGSEDLFNVGRTTKGLNTAGLNEAFKGDVISPRARREGLKPNRVVKKALSTKRPKTFINGRKALKDIGTREGKSLTMRARKRATKVRGRK